MSRRPWLLAIPAVLLLSGCTGPSATTPQSRPAMGLVAFDSCSQLLTELRGAARQSIGPYGLPGAESPALAGGARTMVDGKAEAAAVPAPASPDFSGTNDHEAGADEPDLVKTDGHRIVTVSSSGVLSVVDAVTATTTGRLDLGVSGEAKLLLAGNHALVLVDGGGYQVLGRQIRPAGSGSEVLLVDLSGPPRLLSRYRAPGALIDARQTGDVAHIVLSTRPNLKFPLRADSTGGLLNENQKVIAAASVDAWLPTWEITTGTMTSHGQLGCGSVNRPASFSGMAMLSVLTFDMNAPALTAGDPVGVVTDGDTVYGTPTSLYVVNDQRWRGIAPPLFSIRPPVEAGPAPESSVTPGGVSIPTPGGVPDAPAVTAPPIHRLHPFPERSTPAPVPTAPEATSPAEPVPGPTSPSTNQPGTEIYRFALAGAAKPVLAASGTVPGQLLNQYSMSEWNGYLRVATTDRSQGSSAVRVLQEKDGKLIQVGAVTGLGDGEQIYAVRFIGPRGYVVTFRQIDPLYSLDLAEPTDPRVTGALKITGYSSHLQPIDDRHLIGIGEEATTTDGLPQGAQISLFDVADPAGPRRLAQLHVQDGRSEAGFDPHALLWWPATRLLVVPMTDATSTGALAVRVTGSGLQTIGRINPPDAAGPIHRDLVIGDVLWTVSDSGLLASNLSTLHKIAWVPLS